MMDICKVFMSGTLKQDAKAYFTNEGELKLVNMLIETRGFAKAGEEPKKQLFPVIAFKGNAAKVKDLPAGQKIYFEGRLNKNNFTESQGIEKSEIQIVAENIKV